MTLNQRGTAQTFEEWWGKQGDWMHADTTDRSARAIWDAAVACQQADIEQFGRGAWEDAVREIKRLHDSLARYEAVVEAAREVIYELGDSAKDIAEDSEPEARLRAALAALEATP